MITKKTLFQTTGILVAVTFAQSASAVTVEPTLDELVASQDSPVVDTKLSFMWSPTGGFVPTEIVSGESDEIFIGTAGTDLPGQGLRWHPDYGLVARGFTPETHGAATPITWTETGGATRVVVWNAEDLQALVTKMAPTAGLSVAKVDDVSPNGTVLGQVQQSEDGPLETFTWNPQTSLKILDLGPDIQVVSMSEMNDSGYVIGKVSVNDGPPVAAVILPDGTVRILSGPIDAPYDPRGLNENGEVVGVVGTEPAQAVMWTSQGAPVSLADQLSSPMPDGYILTGAHDINNVGQIVATAVTPEGATALMTLTPDPYSAGMFTPRRIGEIAGPGAAQPITTLSVSDDGTIVGDCVFGALDCPTNPFDFASLDPSITNLVNSTGFGQDGFLRLFSNFPRTGATRLPTATAALDRAGAGGSTGTSTPSIANVNPNFGTPSFPTLATTPSDTGAVVTSSAVPLPAAGFLLMFALVLLRGPARALKVLRRGMSGQRRTA